jgi:hypothetical protein
MYFDALSFLEDDRDAWTPFEQLATLSDEQLADVVPGMHGWSGRDLIAHMVGWQEVALAVARELAVHDTSPRKEHEDADWKARGDVINDELNDLWRALPMDEVRSRLATVPGELRGYLTVVPETRWIKDPAMLKFFLNETVEHYQDHMADLRAVLAAAGR